MVEMAETQKSRSMDAQALSTPQIVGGESRATRLLAGAVAAGFTPADVPFLQPVEPFLDLSGEDLRRRLFLTTNGAGEELCLRPEFTIPAAMDYLASGVIGRRVEQVFLGSVFRHRAGESGEFTQMSLEAIGRTDKEAAEVDLLTTTLTLLHTELPDRAFTITIGDVALFSQVMEALALHPTTMRRLTLGLAEGRMASLLDPAQISQRKTTARGLERYAGVLEALKGADPQEAKAFVQDLLSIAGIAAVGGRTTADIATRFLAQAQAQSQGLSLEAAEILRRFLAIEGEPDAVITALHTLAREAGLNLGASVERFELRLSLMEARGIDLSRIRAATSFARNLNYYSGFVFDVRDVASPALPIAAGGRYDALFARLGHAVPAMGAAIWLERLKGGAA